jgi:hypothetical protein
MADKPKRRRFEGFVHEKIDANLQKALSFLAKTWGVTEQDVPRRAIQEIATHEALTAGVQNLKAKPRKAPEKQQPADRTKALEAENERLSEEVAALKRMQKALEGKLSRIRGAVMGVMEMLNEK